MKAVLTLLAASLVLALVLTTTQCTTGDEPEVVVVPVGEPGSGDPYDSTGELGCGGSTSAQQISTDTVLLTFTGVHDTWIVSMPRQKFAAVLERLNQEEDLPAWSNLEPAQVDALHERFCAGTDAFSDQEKSLYTIVEEILGSELTEIEHDLCS